MNDKQAKSKRRLTRRVLLTLCLTLAVALGAVGGTLAWLTDKEEIVNTFTSGDIDITLTEEWNTDSDDSDDKPDKWTGKMIPGTVLGKDPKVTVAQGSESCYLFVQVTDNFTDGSVIYSIRTGWKQGDGDGEGKDGVPTNVYYRTVLDNASPRFFYILEGDTVHPNGIVTVSGDATKADLEGVKTLTFTAYAIQKAGFEKNVAGAWAEVSKPVTTP